MAQLDRFLSAMLSNRAEELLLNENETLRLQIAGVSRPITRQPLSAQQLLMLLREIAPPEIISKLERGEGAVFEYRGDPGTFAVRAELRGGRGMAVISPAETAVPETPPAPEQSSGAARSADSKSMQAQPDIHLSGRQRDPAAGERMERLLRLLVDRSASDLHLRCGERPILRQSGEMIRVEDEPVLENEDIESMMFGIMPDRNVKELRELNDTDFAYEIAGLARFRANALLERKGAAAVFRVIPAEVVTVDQMGISPEVQKLCYLTKGLVLVTGPTGSGKSTTLCAMVDLVNRVRNDHIITIEDPIEFVHPNKNCIITQRQVGLHTSSFKHALRAALREDPDIILVGELRDLETVSIAIETAETGHLVFGTLHTTTAPSTVDRLIDQFPADRQSQIRVMLSESLKGVISQTLCRRIGGGRVAAREILLTLPSVSNLIREGKTFQLPSVIQTSRKLGMITLNDALIELVDSRMVEPKEAYVKSVDKLNFITLLTSRNHDTSFLESDLGGSPTKAPLGGKPGAPAGSGGARPAAARR